MEVKGDLNYRQLTTAIARILCLALMSCQSQIRDKTRRKHAQSKRDTRATSSALVRSQIPDMELQETPSGSEYAGSGYEPPSSPLQSTTPKAQAYVESGRVSSQNINHLPDLCSDSDPSEALSEPRRKRNFSQVISPLQESSRSGGPRRNPGDRCRQHTSQFCTQRCLLGI